MEQKANFRGVFFFGFFEKKAEERKVVSAD